MSVLKVIYNYTHQPAKPDGVVLFSYPLSSDRHWFISYQGKYFILRDMSGEITGNLLGIMWQTDRNGTKVKRFVGVVRKDPVHGITWAEDLIHKKNYFGLLSQLDDSFNYLISSMTNQPRTPFLSFAKEEFETDFDEKELVGEFDPRQCRW